MTDILRRNNVRVTGSGETCMLFAHGFGCDQNVWRYVIRAFEQDYKIVVFDYVGAGQSDLEAYDPQKYSSLSGYARDVLDVCEALDLRDCIFVGHSVSAMIGIRAALIEPTYFSKLIFVAPSPYYINEGDYVGGMERADLEALLDVMDNNYLGWSASLAPMVMGNPEQPELAEELTANFCATDPTIARQFARVTFLSDNRDDLPRLGIPSLSLQCTDDILAPLEVGRYMERNTPGNTLKVLKATGHCPHMSAPDETIEAIRAYIS